MDYEREAISWDCTEFTDNRPCLDLIEGNPGIFVLLNEVRYLIYLKCEI